MALVKGNANPFYNPIVTQVKIFSGNSKENVEKEVNEYLRKYYSKITVKDVKLSTTSVSAEQTWSVMVVYETDSSRP